MEDTLLVFDDWAMYLMQKWIEIGREYNAIVDARQQKLRKATGTSLNDLRDDDEEAYFALLSYLFAMLDYDVPHHRNGYSAYITLPPTCFERLKALRQMIVISPRGEHLILTGYSENNVAKAQSQLRQALTTIGWAHVGKE